MKTIAPKATEATEGRWLELAEQTTIRTLEKIAARTAAGAEPGELCDEQLEPEETLLTFRVSPQVAVLFQHAVRDLSLAMKKPVSGNQALELLVVHFHTGAEHAEDDDVEKLLAEANADLEAQQEKDAQEVETALESSPTWGAADEVGGASVAREGSLDAWASTTAKLLRNPAAAQLKWYRGCATTPTRARSHRLSANSYCVAMATAAQLPVAGATSGWTSIIWSSSAVRDPPCPRTWWSSANAVTRTFMKAL